MTLLVDKGSMFTVVLCVMLFALCSSVDAQQAARVVRLGFLSAASLSAISARAEAFRHGLRVLGYIEGNNIVIESRHADGQLDHLNALAVELVRMSPDVIITAGPTATNAAKQATAKIPIVMAADSDPVRSGAVMSLSRPGGNINSSHGETQTNRTRLL